MSEDNTFSTAGAIAWLKKNPNKSLTAIKTQLVATNKGNNMIAIKGLDEKTNVMAIGRFKVAYPRQRWTEKSPIVTAEDGKD